MSDLVIQAQEVAHRRDWSQLIQRLQQILQSNQFPFLTQDEQDALVALAIAALEAGDFQTRWEIARVFPAFGSASIGALVQLLQDEAAELDCRWFAARILGDLNDPEAIRALVELLQDAEDEDLSEMAARALANLGIPAIQSLTNLLAEPETRLLAVQALAQIHRPETIAPLLTVVADPQPLVRAQAITALSNFSDPGVATVLMQALRDPVAAVRRAAVIGLGSCSNLVPAMELIPLLADRLWDLNLEVCQQAALALGRLRQDGAIPMLVRSLRSPNTPIELQLEIIRALGWIGSQSALDALQQLLTEFPPLPQLVSQELITTLGNWTAPELRLQASQILIQTLTNQPVLMEDRQLRQIVAMGLGQLKQSVALEPLIQLLADGDARVRLHAIAALKRLAPLAARQHLETLHANQELPQDLQRGVAIALREWPTELSR